MEGRGGMPPASLGPGILSLERRNAQPQQQQNHLLQFTAQNHYQSTVQTQPINQPSPLSLNSDHQDQSPSPWQRMKWTDSMVKLLIMIVYCVGDDAGQQNDSVDHQTKGKKAQTSSPSPSAANAMLMQKKGKWKSVSRAMMEKGFYVSPQQCEDKFNDLNKRYKRVNELLGKGTACRVVENQALLDSMDHLSSRAKEEARKLLNSKHLFFREMCAYHNSGGATCSASISAQPPQHSQRPCFHHSSEAVECEEEKEDEGSDEDDEDDEELGEELGDEFDDGDHRKDLVSKGTGTKGTTASMLFSASSMSASPPLSLSLQSSSPVPSASMEQLKGELSSIGNEEEKRQWLKRKAVELEGKRVAHLCRALELEKQKFKWMRFCCNKEREMERMKLVNERRSLENEHMLLLLRKKEQELVGCGVVGADHLQLMPLH